jgi:hypothetical protein
MPDIALPNHAPQPAKTPDFNGDGASTKTSNKGITILEQDV